MHEILSILKTLATSNAINFVIMAVILGVIIKKLHLGTAFEKSVYEIKNRIEKAEQEKADSLNILHKNKTLLEKLPEDISNLEQTSESKIKAFENKIENNTQKIISELNQTIKKVISIEEKKISNLLTEKTSKNAIERAKNQITELLEKNPDLHNDFIQHSLDELDKVKI